MTANDPMRSNENRVPLCAFSTTASIGRMSVIKRCGSKAFNVARTSSAYFDGSAPNRSAQWSVTPKRSEERRVGKEGGCGCGKEREKENRKQEGENDEDTRR